LIINGGIKGVRRMSKLKKYYHDIDAFLDAYCTKMNCHECVDGEPLSYPCSGWQEWKGDENHILIDSKNDIKEWYPHALAEEMLEALIDNMKLNWTRKEFTIVKKSIKIIEKLTGEKIEDILNKEVGDVIKKNTK
jgi:hypothetical protein